MTNRYLIVCPGPSLNLLESMGRTNIKGYRRVNGLNTIAVNSAKGCGLPFDYWAMQDREVLQGPNFANLLNGDLPVTLWVPFSWVEHEDRRLRSGKVFADFRDLPHLTYSKAHLSGQLGLSPGIPWDEYTVFTAIALAVLNRAKHITIIGADMGGAGYCGEGQENKKTNHSPKRWNAERIIMGHAIKALAKVNIELSVFDGAAIKHINRLGSIF